MRWPGELLSIILGDKETLSSIQEMSTLRNNSLVLSKRRLKGELKALITVVI